MIDITLTQQERLALAELDDLALRSMRSKPVLKLLSKLQEKGAIEFDPFAGSATITAAGQAAITAAQG